MQRRNLLIAGFARKITLFALIFLLSACAPLPLVAPTKIEPDLAPVQAAFEQTVNSALQDTGHNWHNGRIGNMIVNIWGGNNTGLCFHWQALVYRGIQPAIQDTRWRATGIEVNRGTFFEHHAVLVYDPERVRLVGLLDNPRGQSAYVLDPWESGKASIYRLQDWLKKPVTIKVPAKLEDLRYLKLSNKAP